MPSGGYSAPPPQGGPPPNNYTAYAPPPPASGIPTWVWWVVGGCVGGGCIIGVLFAAILFPVFAQAREKAREASCMSNVKQIGLGHLMYAQDYDERYTMAATWQDNIDPYIKNPRVYHCPSVVVGTTEPSGAVGTSYAFNSALDMMKSARLSEPRDTVLTFDSSNFSRNASDAVTSLPAPHRHPLGNTIGFADGHVKIWRDSEPVPQAQILPDTP